MLTKILTLLFALTCASVAKVSAVNFHIDYSAVPDIERLKAFDLAIVDPKADVPIKELQEAGTAVFGYLSIVEISEDAAYLQTAIDQNIPMPIKDSSRSVRVVNIADSRWQPFLNGLAEKMATQGFDGFFLDTADSHELLVKKNPKKQAEIEAALANLIKGLKEAFPEKKIILNRGFQVASKVKKALDGVLVESLFQTYDFGKKTYKAVDDEGVKWTKDKLKDLESLNIPLFVVDYVEPGDLETASETATRIQALGYSALVTTPALSGMSLAPVRRVPRRVAVLYGSPREKGSPQKQWPADTLVYERLQMPLEWMGYETDYFHIHEGLPDLRADTYAGMMLDRELELAFDKEKQVVDWIFENQRKGLKLVLLSSIPFENDDQLERLLRHFGVQGRLEYTKAPVKVELSDVRDYMNFEATLQPRLAEFMDLRAPRDSEAGVVVRITGDKTYRRFEPIIIAPWGAILLDPFLAMELSANDVRSYFDPFEVLARIFPEGQFPAPDTTTRDGLRIFYSHIDGDGFSTLSHTRTNQLCAEVVRDEILTKFPFPITVSVIEAETRGWLKEDNPENSARYEEVARDIFALPNVQAASHSFSHPYVWNLDDVDYLALYETLRVPMNDSVDYPKIDLRREIEGSIRYIQDTLVPAGKKVDLMLWSGNCRPSAEALRITREMGAENMNGGETIITKSRPGLAGVGTRSIAAGAEVQVHAANQNEYRYTNDWKGPFFGGFDQLIETFEMTEHPRRLKAANVYYHFYSAAYLSSLHALKKIHKWCETAPLHSMKAVDVARLVTDSRDTSIYQNGSQWIFVNRGNLRTFRVPVSLGYPDMESSQGITGYSKFEQWLYIHTNGQQRSSVEFIKKPKEYTYLESSTAEISDFSAGSDQISFSGNDLRDVTVKIGTERPGSSWTATINDFAPRKVTADGSGRITLALPPTFTLKLEHSR